MDLSKSSSKPPVLIIGAGIAGLVLGHALRKNNIPFKIFERDVAADSRLQGWALTIHFCLNELLSMLEDDIIDGIDNVQVDPGIRTDKSDSVFINLADCSTKWRLPPGSGTRKRVNRNRFRQLLISNLEHLILWNKAFVACCPSGDGVEATFADGTRYFGLLLVGADGAASKTRALLFQDGPPPPLPASIPVRFLGTTLEVSNTQIAPLLEIDRILFQGCHPHEQTWMWFSVMESPKSNRTSHLPPIKQIWKIQLCLSWIAEEGDDLPAPLTDKERVLKMREKSKNFHPKIRAIFQEVMPLTHTPVLSLDLADWCLPVRPTNQYEGLVTLAGDAAHTMAMYRGEGFNHAIIDVHILSQLLKQLYRTDLQEEEMKATRIRLITNYEAQIRARGLAAVSICRQACLEVHQWDKLDCNSAVRKKRIL